MAKWVRSFSIGNHPILSREIGVTNNAMPVCCVHDLAFFISCLENTLKLWRELPCDFHLSCLWPSLFYQVLVSPAVKWLVIYNLICILLLPCICWFLLARLDDYLWNWDVLCLLFCNCDHDPLAFLEQWTTSIKETPGVRMVFHLWLVSTSAMRWVGTASPFSPARFIRVWSHRGST